MFNMIFDAIFVYLIQTLPNIRPNNFPNAEPMMIELYNQWNNVINQTISWKWPSKTMKIIGEIRRLNIGANHREFLNIGFPILSIRIAYHFYESPIIAMIDTVIWNMADFSRAFLTLTAKIMYDIKLNCQTNWRMWELIYKSNWRYLHNGIVESISQIGKL